MAKTKVAVTLDTRTLSRVDRLVKDARYPNRSQAIEAAVTGQLDRLEHRRLAEECAKLDPAAELDGSGGRVVIGDLRLTDVETGHSREVTVNTELLDRYRRRLADYQDELARFLISRGVGLVQIRSDADVDTLMLGELRRRGILR
jgi:Arc/MetJ-type ribon-helix-helix transcriptional regulator